MSKPFDPDQASDPLSPERRLELLERLARSIAHDLNTQLTAVLGFADLTAADPDLPAKFGPDVQQISLAAHRAGALTGQLQTYCRPRKGQSRLVDLDEVVANSRPARQRMAGRGLEVVDVPAPELTLVHTDPVQVEWWLLDCVATARDAPSRPKQLTFETTHQGGEAHLVVSYGASPLTLVLALASA